MEGDDTICAVSTAAGEGAIGAVRISGPTALAVLRKLFIPRKKRDTFQSHRLYLGHIVDPSTGAAIDEVLAVFMAMPNTYTREDVAEIFSHGGFAAQKGILSLIIGCGARLAEPGEFTKRAFLNGRIDLLQAESVLDLVESETREELANAVNHLSGRLSARLQRIRKTLERVLAETEAQIDFPDDDIDADDGAFPGLLGKAKKEIDGLTGSFYEGRALKEGLEVLIIGRTNVGKSSLLNALLLKERAIVTPMPGTTRDLIEDTLHIRGIKVNLVDTAGLREPRDPAEQEGILRVRRRIPGADALILVLDASEPLTEDDERIFLEALDKGPIVVLNKSDLPENIERELLAKRGIKALSVSAKEETGLEELKELVHQTLMGKAPRHRHVLITNVRHQKTLERTSDAIARAGVCLAGGEPREFIAFELRDALHHLGEITGETCPEEILGEIFARFCIGK